MKKRPQPEWMKTLGTSQLIEITVGREYADALAQWNSINLGLPEQQDTEEFEDDGYAAPVITTKEDLLLALDKMLEEIKWLKSIGATVEYHDAATNTWKWRWPRFNDIVTIPRDLWTNSQSNDEPSDPRANTHDREAFSSQRLPGDAQKPRDIITERVTLGDILDDRNARRLAIEVDRRERRTNQPQGKVTTAIAILRSLADDEEDRYGKVQPGIIRFTPRLKRMAEERNMRPDELIIHVAEDRRLIRPRYKPGFWFIICNDTYIDCSVSAGEYMDNGMRLNQWMPIPD